MKKIVNYLSIITLSILFTSVVQSQDSLLIQYTFTALNHNIEISGIVNKKAVRSTAHFDRTKLSVYYSNDQSCDVVSLREDMDTVSLNIFFMEDTPTGKRNKIAKAIKSLDTNCNEAIIPKWYYIQPADSEGTKNGSTDTIPSKIIFDDTLKFKHSIIRSFIDSLSKTTKTRHLFLLYANINDTTLIDSYSKIAATDNIQTNYYGYISYETGVFKPFLDFGQNLYAKLFKKDTNINKQTGEAIPYDDAFYIQYKIGGGGFDHNDLCGKLDEITDYNLTITFKVAEINGDPNTLDYTIEYNVGDKTFSNSILNSSSSPNPDVIINIEESMISASTTTVAVSKQSPDKKQEILVDNKETKIEKTKIEAKKNTKKERIENPDITIEKYQELINEYYKNKDFAGIYGLGTAYKHKDYHRSSFKMRYYYYHACSVEKDYKMALLGFEWLIDNWEKQNYLSRNEAYVMLGIQLTYNCEFDKALKLNRRIYRDTKDERALNSFMLNIRLKNLILIADAFPVFMQNVKSDKEIKQLAAKTPKLIRSCINGIYLKNRKSGSIDQIIKYNTISPLPSNALRNIRAYPAIIIGQNERKAWIVNRNGNKLIIIDISLSPISVEEKNLMNGIIYNRLMAEPWEDLASFNAGILQKYCTGVLAAMISIDYENGLSTGINNYWKAIYRNSKLVYMVRYSSNGRIVQSKGFLFDNAVVDKELWEKSKTTKTYLEQVIKYNNDKVLDLTNPLFKNVSWVGILKLGFPN